jgi:transcriptional regulator with XRE-family HTH domain
MTTRRRSTIIVVGGALAVASVGYGLGTQADDGTAVAGSGQTTSEENRRGGPPAFLGGGQPPGFQALADKLGVDADKLAQALRDFHQSEEGNRRDDFAASLAKALGISADKVTAAFDKLMNGTPRPPDQFAQALADELGVNVSDVRRALFESRPDRGGRHRDHAMPLSQLASALDVSRADLRKALRELRTGAENGRTQHTQELAKFLADRFDLSADDVAKALDALPHPVRPDHGGRPGPGGPGRGPGLAAPGMEPAPQPA